MLITIINGDEKNKILLKERRTERIKNYALYKED